MNPEEITAGADRPYWAGLQAGRALLPKCASCEKWHWPAVFRCPECGSWEHVWEEVALSGKVYSWTRTFHPFAGAEAFPPPFVSLVVELDSAGGIRLIGTLEGGDGDIAIDDPVSGTIGTIPFSGDDYPALFWSKGAVG